MGPPDDARHKRDVDLPKQVGCVVAGLQELHDPWNTFNWPDVPGLVGVRNHGNTRGTVWS